MKVKFPILFEHRPQFFTFMEFLERNGVRWRSGDLPTYDISGIKFPTYVLYNKSSESNNVYITYLNQEDSDWFRYSNYFNGEVEFENE